MTNRELRMQLKKAYSFNESKKETDFIRAYEQRSMHLRDIILDEFRFLGWQSYLSGVILYVVLLTVSMYDRTSSMWYLSSLLPLIALLMTSSIRRSERYGMSEFEAVCRFSLRFVRQVRMLIIGAASLVLILVSTIIAGKNNPAGFAVVMCFISFPYLLNVFINLLITRKWHSKEDMFFCAAATGFSCLLPSIARLLNTVDLSSTLALALIVMILALTTMESIKFIQEGDKPYGTFVRQCL